MSGIVEDYKKRDPTKRKVARVLCINNQHVLVVKRYKYGETYFVLPGGGIDEGEDPKDAAAREALEETSVVVKPHKVVLNLPGTEHHSEQFIVECSYIAGEPHLPIHSEEALRTDWGQNTYESMWIDCKMAKKEIVPAEVRKLIN